MSYELINAEVISVYPDKVKISVDDLKDFALVDESLKVGSYLRVSDNDNAIMIVIIENFSIELSNDGHKKYIIEALPLGMLINGEFKRGGDNIALPPKKVVPASNRDIENIFINSIPKNKQFIFSELYSNASINIPVEGNKFFNKHVAIVGSTGSGKSHTIAKILQNATDVKVGDYNLNNSHIIIFDIHSEYLTAFPDSNLLNAENIILPYWLLNSEELEEVLLDTGERDNYNQSSIFRSLVTANKKKHNPKMEKIMYDTPVFFDIHEVLNAVKNLKNETINSKSVNRYMVICDDYQLEQGKTDTTSGIELDSEKRILHYFDKVYDFHTTKPSNISKGMYNDGTLEKFAFRLENKINDPRLDFLFGDKVKSTKLECVLRKIMGYSEDEEKNVTVIDLSGIPFEVLSISVSLISRLIFEFGYIYKKTRFEKNENETINNDVPILMVYEEAHKYVPKSDLSKFRSSQKAIERIAKEGRKYGVTLMLSSQRPSEISETIFSQCNNFIVMRLTNPNDQNYVKKLLPDTLGNLINKLPTLAVGEALLLGESTIMPSIVSIHQCDDKLAPSSHDIQYYDLWKEEWKELDFNEIVKKWEDS